ncbi:hypothetical protein AGMMS49940_19490 [Spirochaetia bacterium]|nr:hypothetical protein AGMMS49940_19490 [Spirochaetia bacterium]
MTVELALLPIGLVVLAVLIALGLTGVCVDWEGSYPHGEIEHTSVGIKR